MKVYQELGSNEAHFLAFQELKALKLEAAAAPLAAHRRRPELL